MSEDKKVEADVPAVKVERATRGLRRRYTLEQLLVGLTKETEIAWGPPRGREVW